MKKCIFSVILLALLTGCGKVTDVNGSESRISIVSGTVEGTTRELETTETDVTTDEGTTDEKTTTTKTVGDKVSGTTAVTTKKSNVQSATRASGGSSGGVRGTTRQVPTAPRTTTTTSEQTTTQPPTFDPKEHNSISFGYDSQTPNKIEVLRQYSDGKERSYQVLSVDTTEIQAAMEADPTKTIDSFIVRTDFDLDDYPDLFIIEKQDELNKTGKYYRYDPEHGTYTSWNELNELKYEVTLGENNWLRVCRNGEDRIEQERTEYEWNAQKQLVRREYIHQYKDENGDIVIEKIHYDESGNQVSREVEFSNGQPVDEGNQNDE